MPPLPAVNGLVFIFFFSTHGGRAVVPGEIWRSASASWVAGRGGMGEVLRGR